MRSPLGTAEFAVILAIVILLFVGRNLKQTADNVAQAMQQLQQTLQGNRWRQDRPPFPFGGMCILGLLAVILMVELAWLSTLF